MPGRTHTVEAIFENGLLRPVQALPLAEGQRVRLSVRPAAPIREWPEDTEAIYAEIAEEDRRLAEAMLPLVRESWPAEESQP
jgi:predicted DNA-binding antitoxin AbrB/MazE fold protein